jgi:protein LSM14
MLTLKMLSLPEHLADCLCRQRFNLISKSEIRYVGTLHEINPEQSTIALEDVYSFGTEGRPAKDFIPASNQKFDYIVFRGTDVKDIKIAEEQKENKQPESNVPNDPAILVCRMHPFLERPPDLASSMMKHTGCKSQTCSESAKPCGYFPLPSF